MFFSIDFMQLHQIMNFFCEFNIICIKFFINIKSFVPNKLNMKYIPSPKTNKKAVIQSILFLAYKKREESKCITVRLKYRELIHLN